jgi:molecular chaperone GrpE
MRKHKDERDEQRRPLDDAEGRPPEGHDGEGGPEGVEDAAARLQHQLDDLNDKYLRTLADYQNSQRRAVANEREAKEQGIKSVVLNVLPVLDHFELALGQDVSKVTAEQLLKGVLVIRDELVKVLANHGVAAIAPRANDEFDPNKHQAVTRQEAEGVEPGRVVATLQTGYLMGERVVRPAMVAVRPAE